MSTAVTSTHSFLTADPHVGHMHSMVLADVHRRYKALWGKSTLLSTGTDDHGMKVLPPEKVVDNSGAKSSSRPRPTSVPLLRSGSPEISSNVLMNTPLLNNRHSPAKLT